MLQIGLTGGIAAGKSVVARRFEERGAVLVDADVLARTAVEPGSDGLREVAEAFGPDVLTPEGTLDRPALGARIFGDASARGRLNAIIHPRVRTAAAEIVAGAPEGALIVEDIPLLVETGQAPRFHLVVVVDAPDTLRVRRMMETRGSTRQDAEQRIAAQASRKDRLRDADAVLTNDGALATLLAAADALWDERILPFSANVAAGRPAAPTAGGLTSPSMALLGTEDLGRRVRAKLAVVLEGQPGATVVDEEPHEPAPEGGSGPGGPPGEDAIRASLTVQVDTVDAGDRVSTTLGPAGLPLARGGAEPLHIGADPATSVTVHVRRRSTSP